MRIALLTAAELAPARTLLTRCLIHDRIDVVAEEKLFGDNGLRSGSTLAAWDGDTLVGVVALAGRFIKLLAVAPEARRRGAGSALLARARAAQPGAKLRACDHPGNYLSPGLDVRYSEGHAFFEHHGFSVLVEVENIRAPLDGNPKVSRARADELAAAATARGYQIRRASEAELPSVIAWIGATFAPVWGFEAARAAAGPCRALHVAWQGGRPVAFAAADGNNRGLGWFGPAGTAVEHRGRGLGEALLIPCLDDVRALPEGGVIAWIGPKAFYEKACGAVEDRRFRVYEASA